METDHYQQDSLLEKFIWWTMICVVGGFIIGMMFFPILLR